MGADLIIAGLAIDDGRKPDWPAAHAAVDALTDGDIIERETYWDLEVDFDTGALDLEEVCTRLHGDLGEVQAAIDGERRDATFLVVRGVRVFLTGGLSSGDSPTDTFDHIERLCTVPKVLAAAGFDS